MTVAPWVCRMDRYQGLLWSAPVRVAGRERRFLFDLGAGVTSLDARLAAELGLREVGRVEGRRMTGAKLDLALVEPVDLEIGGRRVHAAAPGRIDFSSLLPADWPAVDGVLGLDVLERVPFTADFAQDRLELGTTGDLAGVAPTPVRLHRQIAGTSLVVLVPVGPPGAEAWFELDNSNTGPVLVSPATAARLGIAATAGAAQTVDLDVGGVGRVRGPALVRELIYDGNLGRTFVDGRRIAFDLAAERVWIGPAAAPPR
jgi:hypothetical protein